MSKKWLIFALPLTLALAGCPSDDDDDTTPTDTGPKADTGTPDTGAPDTGAPDTGAPDTGMEDTGVPDTGFMIPMRPALGTQLDRNGRPAISTALVQPLGDEPAKGTRKDEYNAAEIANWADFAVDIIGSLGVYDSLDGTCGNQLGAGPNPTPDRYATLGGAITDDRLYVKATSTTCTTYFAVEVDALQVLPNDDCGGRTPTYDVINTTYSALAAGVFAGVSDGIDSDDVVQDPATFPFLADPQ